MVHHKEGKISSLVCACCFFMCHGFQVIHVGELTHLRPLHTQVAHVGELTHLRPLHTQVIHVGELTHLRPLHTQVTHGG